MSRFQIHMKDDCKRCYLHIASELLTMSGVLPGLLFPRPLQLAARETADRLSMNRSIGGLEVPRLIRGFPNLLTPAVAASGCHVPEANGRVPCPTQIHQGGIHRNGLVGNLGGTFDPTPIDQFRNSLRSKSAVPILRLFVFPPSHPPLGTTLSFIDRRFDLNRLKPSPRSLPAAGSRRQSSARRSPHPWRP